MNESEPGGHAAGVSATTNATQTLGVKQTLLSEFDDEIATTRRLLERVPDAALSWKPHDKSMSTGELAAHLGRLVHWGLAILDHAAHDLAHDEPDRPDAGVSRAALLELFDRSAAELRRALVGCTDGELAAPWTLRSGDDLVMSLPRASAIRRFLLNHLVHHRGQLTVYLRMHDVPIPPLYGPTADERM